MLKSPGLALQPWPDQSESGSESGRDTGSDGGSVLAAGVRRREILAWSLYDFANSGYATVVLTAVYNVFFVDVPVFDAVPMEIYR